MCVLDGICTACGGRGIIWRGSEGVSRTCWRCGGDGKWRRQEDAAFRQWGKK